MGSKIATIKGKLAQSLEIWSKKELEQIHKIQYGWR